MGSTQKNVGGPKKGETTNYNAKKKRGKKQTSAKHQVIVKGILLKGAPGKEKITFPRLPN